MSFMISFRGETYEETLTKVAEFLSARPVEPSSIAAMSVDIPPEPKKEVKRRTRKAKPKAEEKPAEEKKEEKPKPTRRRRSTAKAEEPTPPIRPLMKDAMKMANQGSEKHGEGYITELLQEEYQVDNVNQLNDDQLEEFTGIVEKELESTED